MRLFGATAIAALAALVGTSVAVAKSPPLREYECTISGTLFGDIVITGGTTVPGYTIVFKTGPLKGYKGRWDRSKTGINEIALRNPLNGFESIYCDD